ncbi:MAG: hypothetical protein OEX07_15970, partial [Gammaproteobacteria bacterium]|nr:hypothetical protein [Gammaproteobacteria bacterium]
LLDLQKYLEKYLPAIWLVIDEDKDTDSLNNAEQALISILKTATISGSLKAAITGAHYTSSDVEPSLYTALKAVKSHESNLESVDVPYLLNFDANGNVIPPDSRWPSFLFPLTDPDYGGDFSFISGSSKELIPSVGIKRETELNTVLENLNEFSNLVSSLLPEDAVNGFTNDFMQSRPVLDQKEGWFVVRCVYERPNCGPAFPALVSEATRPFQIAAFFDPDAPQRPFKINMPADISPAGLRKYSKNVGFVMSDMLCGKIKAIRSLGFVDLVLSVLPWPFHKDLPNVNDTGPCTGSGGGFGMICSLSIPIVTLCALILLIIMVSLFNMFFYWLPLLFLCLPIPGLKGK